MKEFKAQPKVKAFIEIDGKKFEFFSPTISEIEEYHKEYLACKSDNGKVTEVMLKLMSTLSKCPVETLKKMDNVTFYDLFEYITQGEKKS